MCSLHFKENDFRVDLKTRRLLPTAVPTIFAEYPKYLQEAILKKNKKRKPPTTRTNLPQVKKSKINSSEELAPQCVTEEFLEHPSTIFPRMTRAELLPTLSNNNQKNIKKYQRLSPKSKSNKSLSHKIRVLQHQQKIKNAKLIYINSKLREAQQQIKAIQNSEDQKLHTIKLKAEQGNRKALMILEQIDNFDRNFQNGPNSAFVCVYFGGQKALERTKWPENPNFLLFLQINFAAVHWPIQSQCWIHTFNTASINGGKKIHR